MNQVRQDSAWLKLVWGLVRFLIGSVFGLICVAASLMIWIGYFDNDGGEPGATTIFGAIYLWPVFLALILGVGAFAAIKSRFFFMLVLVTFILVAWAAIMVGVARRDNAAKAQQYSHFTVSIEKELLDE